VGDARTTQKPLRLLYVLEYFPPHLGGVETLFGDVTAALARAGHRVTVVTLRLPGTPTREVRDGVHIRRVRTPRWARRGFFTLLAFPFVLRHALGADLVHAATPNAAVPVWFAAAIARKPAVHTVHEVFAELIGELPGLQPWRARLFQWYERSMLRLPFAHYLCDSDFTRRRLIRIMGIPAARTSVLYLTIDYALWDAALHAPRPLRDEFALAPGTFLFLYFGRPGFLKGVEYLLDAAARVRARLPESRLVMLLDRDPPDQYRRIMQRVARLGLDGYAIVRDPVPRAELPGYLLGADCVVVPSLSEGFGYAAVEAATLGCRVVTTAGHAVEEVVGDAVTLVPPRDAEALAAAIVAARGAGRGTPAPRRFTFAAHVAALLGVYRGVLDRRHRLEESPDATVLDEG
jgi:D-inositol-3-phosphate glycosyltransferase